MLKSRPIILLIAIASTIPPSFSQTDSIPDDEGTELEEIIIRTKSRNRLTSTAGNSELITAQELTRAACCSLGESFTTNPSVDVSYSDAATGAKQIRLLGLSGIYTQMLTENVPNFRGVANSYSLDYVPGPWIQSIQISKGTSSVKNGFEAITGQINIEMLKPQAEKGLHLNAYFDSDGRLELNAAGNLHLGKKWSGGVLFNGTNSFWSHDANHDGFTDMPKVKRLMLANRWAYLGEKYVFQIFAKGLIENRKSGQLSLHSSLGGYDPYIIDITSKRLELFTKNAYIIDKETDTNIALILSGNLEDLKTAYGLKRYDGVQGDIYASLMFERKWAEKHSLSAGINWQYDDYRQHYRLLADKTQSLTPDNQRESTLGAYGQYTFNLEERLILMGGLRYDYDNLYGSFVTPRVHVRYNPTENWSLHASVGTGLRSPHPMAEYHFYLASSRRWKLPSLLGMETAVNTGAGLNWKGSIGERSLTLSGEYYYTRLDYQLAVDLNNPREVQILADAKGYSHNIQVEMSFDPIEDMTITGAYRYTDVKVDYGHGYQLKPLTSRHKGLLTVGYNPFMGKWQFDATLSINGGGTMPTPYVNQQGEKSWADTYPAFCTLNLQITRNFRKWSVYAGCENLTSYRQKNPIIEAEDPWGSEFDATMVWGPLQGIMGYVGVRVNL